MSEEYEMHEIRIRDNPARVLLVEQYMFQLVEDVSPEGSMVDFEILIDSFIRDWKKVKEVLAKRAIKEDAEGEDQR